MVLSDFLSTQNNDKSNPHEIIPISFNIHQVLHENYYDMEKYLVQTRSQAKSSGIKLLEVHGREFRSQHKTRKTTCQSNKTQCRETNHRSR